MKIYAWVETGPPMEELTIRGGKLWGRLVDGLILSIDRGYGADGAVESFERISLALEGVEIIPGVKTSPILGHDGFDNPEKWAEVVAYANRLGRPGSPLVLEHESAVRNYLRASDPLVMDYGRLERCVRQFEGRELWWYPGMAGGATNRHVYGRIARMADGRDGSNNVRFVDLSISRNIEHTYDSEGAVRLRRELGAVARFPVIPMIYTIKGYWKPEEVPWARQFAVRAWSDVTTMIVYPGDRQWVESAQEVQREQSKKWFQNSA